MLTRKGSAGDRGEVYKTFFCRITSAQKNPFFCPYGCFVFPSLRLKTANEAGVKKREGRYTLSVSAIANEEG